jgi:hypothetical protein
LVTVNAAHCVAVETYAGTRRNAEPVFVGTAIENVTATFALCVVVPDFAADGTAGVADPPPPHPASNTAATTNPTLRCIL